MDADRTRHSDAELTDTFRAEVIAHLDRQSKALEKINGTMTFFLVVFLVGLVLWVLFVVLAGR